MYYVNGFWISRIVILGVCLGFLTRCTGEAPAAIDVIAFLFGMRVMLGTKHSLVTISQVVTALRIQ